MAAEAVVLVVVVIIVVVVLVVVIYLFDLILIVPSTIFQLYWDGYSGLNLY